MLPDPHDRPAGAGQCLVGVFIAPLVAGDLARPIPTIDIVAPAAMFRAPVPKTAVDKHCYPSGPEHDVRFTPQPDNRSPVKAVPQTEGVEGASQSDFGAGALANVVRSCGAELPR